MPIPVDLIAHTGIRIAGGEVEYEICGFCKSETDIPRDMPEAERELRFSGHLRESGVMCRTCRARFMPHITDWTDA